MKRNCFSGLAVLVVLGFWANPASAQTFTYTTLDDPSASHAAYEGTRALGIDGSNIVGDYEDSSNVSHGFLYNVSTQTYTTLNDPSAGTNGTTVSQGTHAFGISGNNIVGSYLDSSSSVHGFLYNVSTQAYTTLNDPSAGKFSYYGTSASGIDGNNIVGNYQDSSYLSHGFLYNVSTQTYTTLNDPSAGTNGNYLEGTSAYGIDGNNIVGSYVDSSDIVHGFLYNVSTQTYTTLNDPSAGTSAFQPTFQGTYACGIDGNDIVGFFVVSGETSHGYLYNISTQTYTTLNDAPLGTNETFANDISGNNIVGDYIDSSNVQHGFVATVPEPSTIALFGVGAVALIGYRWRRRAR